MILKRLFKRKSKKTEKCQHDFFQSSLTLRSCVIGNERINHYPHKVEQTCRKCKNKRMVRNKYEICCRRGKLVGKACEYCGKVKGKEIG